MTLSAESPTAEPLWTRARAMFARAVAAIGGPAAIAAIALLGRTLRREIISWLCPLEHIARKLLLAEAAEIHRAEVARIAREPRIVRVPLRGMAMHWQGGSAAILDRRRPRRPASANADEDAGGPRSARYKIDKSRPETWSARFSFALPVNERLVSNARAPRIRNPWAEYAPPPAPPPRAPRIARPEDAPFRLARRFEALRRVLADPRRHAERLARVLAREVRRFSAVVMRYMLAGPRTDAYDPADPRLSLDALGQAFNAPEAFKDTS